MTAMCIPEAEVDMHSNQISASIMHVETAASFFWSGSNLGANDSPSNPTAPIAIKNPIEKLTECVQISMPLTTKVAECSSADTGDGPSIASGSQTKVVIMIDLHEIASKINSRARESIKVKCTRVITFTAQTSIKMSPSLLKVRALLAPLFALGLLK